jgi:hypothetical protein
MYATANRHPGRKKYFDSLYQEIKNGGLEAFLHYLLNYDYSDVDLSDPPETVGKAEQKKESMRSDEKWWYGVLNRGVLPGDWEGEGYSSLALLYRDYERTAGRHPVTDSQLALSLRKWVGVQALITDSRSGHVWHVEERKHVSWRRGYQFPSLADCRAAFAKEAPGLTWDNADVTDWCEDNRYRKDRPMLGDPNLGDSNDM